MEASIKIIILGNGGAGKSSLLRRWVYNEYDDNYKKTIGAAFMEKEHYVKSIGESVKFLLWDTAGQEEFDSVTRRYYRGAGACILAFSTTDRASYLAVEKWNQKVKEECGDICTVLIQNKIDLIDQAVVEQHEAESLAKKLQVNFFRTSVKKNFNITAVFDSLAEQYLAKHGTGGDLDLDLDLDAGIDLDDPAPTMSITDHHEPAASRTTFDNQNTGASTAANNTNPQSNQRIDQNPQGQNRSNDHFQLHEPDDTSQTNSSGRKKKKPLHWCKIL